MYTCPKDDMITNNFLVGCIITGFPGDRTKESEVNPIDTT